MQAPKAEKAVSWDLDDTLFRRRVARRLGVLKAKFTSSHVPNVGLDALPEHNWGVSDDPLCGFMEIISFAAHAQRPMIPEARKALLLAKAEGADNYANTGRSNKRRWVQMSMKSLRRNDVSTAIDGMFFTQPGIKTAVSKAAAIRELFTRYKQVTHYEDDPRTAVYLAKLFPELKVFLVVYPTTAKLFPEAEVNACSNIQRIVWSDSTR